MDGKSSNFLDCNFLEVTINSNKLMGMLDRIAKQLSEQSAEIKIIKETIPTIKQSVQNSLDMTEKRIHLQHQKLEQKVKTDAIMMNEELKEIAKIVNNNYEQVQTKINANQQSISKLESEKNKIEETIRNQEKNRIEK